MRVRGGVSLPKMMNSPELSPLVLMEVGMKIGESGTFSGTEAPEGILERGARCCNMSSDRESGTTVVDLEIARRDISSIPTALQSGSGCWHWNYWQREQTMRNKWF